MTNWTDCIAQLTPQLVPIQSAERSGTGFILYGSDGGARFIATARHLIEPFPGDQRSFFVGHGAGVFGYGMPGSNDALNIRLTERPDHDASVFAVINKRLPKPAIHLVTQSERAAITPGVEVGWLGFPSLEHLDADLSFFSGRVSRVDPFNHRYLIDGTNVPGCSGGPVFLPTPDGPRIIGALTDYFPHAVGDQPETAFLPGLSAAVDVSEFQALEGVLGQLRPAERQLSISLDKCPKCKGLAAIPGISDDDGMSGVIAFQPAYQLSVEALDPLLKALLAQQGMTPPRIHPLSSLYKRLLPCNKAVVDQAVRDAIDESATGALPYGLPNIGAAGLLKPFELGVDQSEEDRTQGFQDMDVHEFFEMLDAEWEAAISQYMGYTRGFVIEKQTMRVNTRVLAGAIHACLALAEHIIGPEEDPTDYGFVLVRRGAPGRFVASTSPCLWTDRIEEAEIFDTLEKGIEAVGGALTDWIGFRRRRET